MGQTKKVGEKKPEQKFATVEQFEGLENTLKTLVDVVTKIADRPAPPQTTEEIKKEKEVVSAGPNNNAQVNPIFDAKAREILGDDVVERTEMVYLKNGGNMFTVVIKKEKSNAPKQHMDMYREDRRSKEIGQEGVDGVEAYCKLIKSNLARPR